MAKLPKSKKVWAFLLSVPMLLGLVYGLAFLSFYMGLDASASGVANPLLRILFGPAIIIDGILTSIIYIPSVTMLYIIRVLSGWLAVMIATYTGLIFVILPIPTNR